MTTHSWVRFRHDGQDAFGLLDGGRILVHEGDLFQDPRPTGAWAPLDSVSLLAPVRPGKAIALWNNFGQLSAKLGLSRPADPLYLLKAPNSFSAPGAPIERPPGVDKLVFEGELGVVIGRRASRVSPEAAEACVFGFTCANDVTVADIITRDPAFPQWARAKGFDTFCPFGPAVVTGLRAETLRVRTWVDGQLRQDYPIGDMHFAVPELVSRLSHDMTLFPGDLVLCGTSVGVGSMKAGATVSVEIDGIGRLTNPVV